ncbi:Methionine biosynthesis protein MetW [Desulfosporosinus acidiphilus SJ4]|uniref:Methionine biosynthesis protein MetW n=1 Tax=Desulfosporosinus acidiphilus (strain DSM 22704 / JCM 16185 / SJ4) TaxID=646529 RepID=I4DBT6_DESAJ|nr:class I SAM-dependent methyltransferase [Desulfosporosinus acidiphilus]AFM43260.1 Methionine biosynthesis protein MetW [Desulfosporosinus acidiphilus SJ4]
MANSHLTIEEVMRRIQDTMKTKKTTMILANSNNITKTRNTLVEEKGLSSLDSELRQNNLTWNIIIDYPITSHRKIIGRFIVFGKKFVRKFLRWYINPPIDRQREFNASVTRTLNILGDYAHEQTKALQEILTKNHDLDAIMNSVNHQFEELSISGRGFESFTDNLKDKADRNDVELLKGYLAGKAGSEELEVIKGLLASKVDESKFEAIRDMLAAKVDRAELSEKIGMAEIFSQVEEQTKRSLEPELTLIADRLRRLERKINKGLNLELGTQTVERLIQEDKNDNLDIDYFLFEQRFRGSREEIKERQKVYLDYFRNKSNVLDIGCGRGEFVELLSENGIGVMGIDLNEDMVGYCQDRGLPVIQSDLFTYLEGQEDNSLDGIIALQVIEHLESRLLIRFINLVHSKLKVSGILILETINPQNIQAISNWFYMDLSHIRPVHPITLQFVAESVGLKVVDQLALNPDISSRISTNSMEQVCDSRVDLLIDRFNSLFYDAQDYAIVLRKEVV